MKQIALLGCSGSIGRQTLDVVAWHPDQFRLVALAARSDSPIFREQVYRHRPALAVVTEGTEPGWEPEGVRLAVGEAGLLEAATLPEADIVVVATSGRVGLRPTLAALATSTPVALANKEALVTAGHLVMRTARESGAAVLPVDSEHSAVWQCLLGEQPEQVRSITLTASGGALRDLPLEMLPTVTPEQALRHPNWRMGPKITVDSATLMNKGLEVLEAACLFGLELRQIEVVLHRESIVHALVQFVDGAVKAQLAAPDMRLPIMYALSYPARLPAPVESLDLVALGKLSFAAVDPRRYPCLELAYEAGRRGGTYPAVLNASNEEAVHLFLNGAIGFCEIARLVERALERHVPIHEPGLDDILEADAWARRFALDQGLLSATRTN